MMSAKQWLVLIVLVCFLFLSPVLLWSFFKYWIQFLVWWTGSQDYTAVSLVVLGIVFLIVSIGFMIEHSSKISRWWNDLNPNSNRSRY